jgi:hypothetical protein
LSASTASRFTVSLADLFRGSGLSGFGSSAGAPPRRKSVTQVSPVFGITPNARATCDAGVPAPNTSSIARSFISSG